jgi:hypothetical protein
MKEHTIEHNGVTITVHAPMLRGALATALQRALNTALCIELDDEGKERAADDTPYPELVQLRTPRQNFAWLVANTKSVSGIDWTPPTMRDTRDPERVLQSFVDWLGAVDVDLNNAWADAVIGLDVPVDEDTGPAPLPGDADPKDEAAA